MSCLFQSIGQCIGMPADKVRADIVDFMIRHGEKEIHDLKLRHWVEAAEDKPWEVYVRDMSSSSTWGGGLELDVACILYDIDIAVHHMGRTLTIGTGTARMIHLDYTGSHYTARAET